MSVVAEDRGERGGQAFVEHARGRHDLERRTRFVNRLDREIEAVLSDVFLEVQIKVRAARHREDFAVVRIHQNHRAAVRFEFRQAGVHFLLDDRLQAHVDGELHVESGARRQQAGGVAGHDQAAGVAAVFAPAIAAGEVVLHRGLHAEAAEHPGLGFPLVVGFLDFAGEADEVGGEVGRGVPALDRVLEFEALDPVLVHRLAEIVGDVLRDILGDGHPLALAGFDFVAEFLAAHAERPGEHAHRVGEMFADDGLGRFVGEDFAAQAVDAAALFGGIQIVPPRFRAGLLIGEAVAGDLGIEQMVLVHEHGGHRDAFRQRFLAAVHDHAADGRQFLDPVEGFAGAFRIAVAVDQLDLDQPARKHTEPDHQDRAQDDAAGLEG